MSYKLVSYHPKKKLEQELQNPSFKQEWEALEDEFAALDVLLKASEASENLGANLPTYQLRCLVLKK